MTIFRQELVPQELARVTEGQKWLREPSAEDFLNHLKANLQFNLQRAAEQTLNTPDMPNMANAATENLKEAHRYKAAIEILEALMSANAPFQTLK